MRLGSGVAVAVVQAGSCSSSSTPSLETSIGHRFGPKKTKRKEERKKCLTAFSQESGGVGRLDEGDG